MIHLTKRFAKKWKLDLLAANNIYYMSSLLFIPLQTRLFNDFYKLRSDENNIGFADRVVNIQVK